MEDLIEYLDERMKRAMKLSDKYKEGSEQNKVYLAEFSAFRNALIAARECVGNTDADNKSKCNKHIVIKRKWWDRFFIGYSVTLTVINLIAGILAFMFL